MTKKGWMIEKCLNKNYPNRKRKLKIPKHLKNPIKKAQNIDIKAKK